MTRHTMKNRTTLALASALAFSLASNWPDTNQDTIKTLRRQLDHHSKLIDSHAAAINRHSRETLDNAKGGLALADSVARLELLLAKLDRRTIKTAETVAAGLQKLGPVIGEERAKVYKRLDKLDAKVFPKPKTPTPRKGKR